MKTFFPLLLMLLFAGCSLSSAETALLPPTATTLRVSPSTVIPVTERDLNAIPDMQVLATNTPRPQAACLVERELALPQHTITAEIDYARRTANVRQIIHYTNAEEVDLSQLVLNAEMTRYPGAFTLKSLTLSDDSTPAYELTGQRLTVELPQPLPPGCVLEIRAEFDLLVPPIGEGVDAFKGFFGYSGRQINLSLWLLTVAVRRSGDWVTHDAFAIGEQSVLDVANWEVTLDVENATEALIIAGPGTMTQPEAMHWRFNVETSRDFAISLSEGFVVSTAQTSTGISVELYSYPDTVFRDEEGDLIDSPAHALDVAVQSLELFTELFGVYPLDRFVIVHGDFPDGMEFSGLVFVSGDWFYGNRGGERNYLTIITTHEVAHQWWYAQVGNDQALDPWLDESLATYSEALFYARFYPDSLAWWWEFRVDRLAPEGFVDSTVYEFPSIRAYINAVYLRGVRMLRDLRADLGDGAFFAWLRRYAETGGGRVATPNLFWSLLSTEELEATRETRFAYLRNPDILTEDGGD